MAVTSLTAIRSITPRRSILVVQGIFEAGFRKNFCAAAVVFVDAPLPAVIGTGACGVGRRIKSDHRQRHHRGHVGGPGVRRQQHCASGQERQKLRQRVLADLIDEGAARGRADRRAHGALDGAAAAYQHDPHLVAGDGVIRHRRVALGRPVSGRVAGAGADQQRRPFVGDDAAGILQVNLAKDEVPGGRPGLYAACAHEPHERIEHVFRGRRRDARVGEPPLQLARPRAVEAELDGSPDQAAHQARANRQLHVEQQLEAPAAQGRTQPHEFLERCALIEGDKLDFRENRRHQPGFDFADDPGEAGLRPCRLQGSKRRHRMAGIADSRKTQQTHVLQRWFEI